MKSIVILLIISSFVFAGKVPVNLVKGVDAYISKLEKDRTLSHRSGLINLPTTENDSVLNSSPSALSILDDDQSLNEINRNKPEIFEFEISYQYPSINFIKLFEKFALNADLPTQYYDTINNTLTFISKTDKILNIASHYQINPFIPKDSLENIAKNAAITYIPQLRGRIEFERTDITMKNGTDLLGVDVCFRRIFRNGVILDNVSPIIISVNGNGEITSLRVKWPSFVKLNTPDNFFTYQFYRNVAIDAISNIADSTDAEFGLSYVTVSGIAKGWHLVNTGDKQIMSPCLSFQCDITAKNGDNYTRFLSVPVLKKYYSKY